MYGKPFNEKHAFGEIFGDNRFAFEQDGQLYNALKEPVDQDGKRMDLPPKAAEPELHATKTEPIRAEDPDDDIPADEKAIDLLAWARGAPELQSLPWITVKAQAAQLVGNMMAVNGKDNARKAILAHYGVKE